MGNQANSSALALTLDVDWAPDFMIDFVADILIEHRVRATWYITHESPSLARLRAHRELFELGIHPNFFSGSTHGESPTAVLGHCMEIVPEAVSVRTHGLLQSTALLGQIMKHTPVRTDASLFLPHAPDLTPVEYWWEQRTLLRVPYFWEDDFEMERVAPCWKLAPLLDSGSGLKVLDFHPVHVYLNSRTMGPYHALKERAPRLPDITAKGVAEFIRDEAGTRTLFIELAKHLNETGESLLMRDIHRRWQQRHESHQGLEGSPE